MLSGLSYDDAVFSEAEISDEDFREEHDLEMYSDDYYADESTSIVEDSEADELMESLQLTEREQEQVVLDERLWEALPTEVLDKILTWLPPAPIFRFRAVCKRWKELLRQPGWLKHYAQVKSRHSCTIMCTLGAREANFFCHSQQRWFDVPYNPVNLLGLDWELVDAHSGLICYQCNCSGDLWLCVCNPLTQSSRVVPPNYPHSDAQPSHCEILKLIVNRKTQSFKVVVLVHSSIPETTVVYDSKNSEWRVCKSFLPQEFRGASSFVWKNMIYVQSFFAGKLLAFDVESGLWSEANADLPCHAIWRYYIVNNNDRILLVQPCGTVMSDAMSVWQLQTDPSSPTLNFSRQKWVQVSIFMPVNLKNLLTDIYSCFSQTDRICFSTSFSNKWITYNFSTRSWRVMPSKGRRDAGYYFFELEPRLDLDVESAPL